MNLKDIILNIKPREESGSSTSGKYDYQKDLSLFLLLKKHESLDDYVFLFDFHEDLLILDSASEPLKIDFYQIKSKNSGQWTIRNFTKAEKDKLSIIGKLYNNKVNFEEHVNSLNFISNANYSFKDLKDGSKSNQREEITADLLDSKDLESIDSSITKEHSLTSSEFQTLGAFHVSILSNKDSGTHCVGELNRLINILNPENSINSELAYKQIINEISRKTRTTISDKSINNLNDLIELKGISKSLFIEYLKQAGLYRSINDEWTEVKSSLEACNMGHLEIQKYKKSWVDMSARLLKDTNNIPLNNLKKEITSVIKREKENGGLTDSMKLIEIIKHCHNFISSDIYDEYFIKCLIIYIINEE